MIGTMLALLVAAAQASPLPAAPPLSAPAEAPLSPLEAARENAARVEQLYAQSCGVRAYAAYDDLCGPLGDEVHRNRVALDRLEREAARHPKPASNVAKPADSTPALSSH
jgi:hypothetical protein